MAPLVSTDILNIVLLGPNGAGKGTQAQLLTQAYNLRHFVTGELLKHEMKRRTAIGKKVDRIVRQGKLVPDAVVKQLLTRYLKSVPKKIGLVIDGSPRKLSQKKMIDRMLTKAQRRSIALLIDISEAEAVRRLKKRKICVGCGNRTSVRDLSVAECRACGGHLVTRVDDQPQIVRRRLQVYRRQVLPVVRAYQREGRLYRINAERSRRAVFASIVRLLTQIGFTPNNLDQLQTRT
ncbi:MAG: nucleoside monophosphate kinase [Parcubacteria group bacterium]